MRRRVFAEHAVLHLALAAAIQSLPGRYFEAIFLRYFKERSIDEMSDKLLLARKSVKNRIFWGRPMLQAYFEDGCRRWMQRNASGSAVWARC